MSHLSFPIRSLAVLACLALTACGGGGSNAPGSANIDAQVTSKSTEVATASGADTIGSGIYDLIADIGDTWRITFNSSSNTFDLQVLQTVYGLSGVQGTFTATTPVGSRTTYTLQSGGNAIGTLTADSSTRTIAGNLKVGTKNASVSGTGYKATTLSKLAGTYNFMLATRNANAYSNLDFGVGQMKINTDGQTAQLCRSGKFIDNICSSVGGPTPEIANLSLSLDNGQIVFSGFGRGSLVASDLGKSLVIDMARTNEENVPRTGVFYLTEAKTLSSTVINGSWACNKNGIASNTLSITGTSGSSQGFGPVSTGTFNYNHVNKTDNTWIAFDGFAAGGASTDPVSDYSIILPLSSTLMVMESDQGLRICHKTQNN